MIIERFRTIADRYDALFCDVWGVIHNGRRIYPGAAEALSTFRNNGGVVILLTNIPKPRGPIPEQLDRLGFPRNAYDVIVTSGDAIRSALSARAPGPMYKIGPPRDAALWQGLGLKESPMEHARFVGISGLNEDDEAPEAYADVLKAARARNLDMLCANPDIVVRVGDQLMWCAGAVAREYENIGGRVVMAGKPHAPIYELAFRELTTLRGLVERSRVLCIGDGLGTDVAGANSQGIDCLFVASGMHGEALMTGGALDGAKVNEAMAAEGVSARWVIAGLK